MPSGLTDKQRIDRLENQIAAIAYQMQKVIRLFENIDITRLSLEDRKVIAEAMELLQLIQHCKKG